MSLHLRFHGGTLVLENTPPGAALPAPFRWVKGKPRCPASHYASLLPWLKEYRGQADRQLGLWIFFGTGDNHITPPNARGTVVLRLSSNPSRSPSVPDDLTQAVGAGVVVAVPSGIRVDLGVLFTRTVKTVPGCTPAPAILQT